MYNRYIPQSDGTYQRSRVPDPVREQPQPKAAPRREREEPPEEACPCEPEAPPCQKGQPCAHTRPPCRPSPPPPRQKRSSQPVSAGSFLRRLLPKDFDTEDLLIVILLRLMAGDCQEEQNSALLTLALYLFM